ncbi:GNAT family N-acetyltransferase [Patescibacteria group bacterium]
MKISKPSLNDIPELLKLWRGQYKYHNDLDNYYYVSNSIELDNKFTKYLKIAINKNNPNILIATINNQIVGFITFEKSSTDYFDTKIKQYGEVIELFVSKEFRKRGIGKKLLTKVEKYFSEKGIEHIEIQCSTFNKDALDFYKNSNYVNRQTLLFKKI